jgi:hypothetical protein
MLHIVAKGCGGNEFLDWVKKISSPLHTPKHKLRSKLAMVTVRSVGQTLTWDFLGRSSSVSQYRGGGLTPYRTSFYVTHCTLFFQLGTHVVLLRTLRSSLETLQYHTPTLMIWKLFRDCRMTFK